MKRIVNVILALTITTLLSGCGIKFGISDRNENSNTEYSSGVSQEVNINESMNEISKLDISIGTSNVKVNYYDGVDINISGRLSKYSKGIKTERNSDILLIIEESKKTNINGDNLSNLVINIPKSFSGDFDFSFGVGEANISNLELKEVNISSGVGEMNLKDLSFNKLSLESGVGTTNLITSKKTGEINIDGGVGETNITLEDIGGNLTFEGGVGSAVIKVPVNAPINIKSKSGLGEAEISAKTSNDAKYTFDVKVGLGDIEVTN